MGDNVVSALKEQGKAILVMVFIAVLAVLGMVVLGEFNDLIVDGGLTMPLAINLTAQATLTAFIAGFALVGTFAVITMLVVVTKAIIGVVKGLG